MTTSAPCVAQCSFIQNAVQRSIDRTSMRFVAIFEDSQEMVAEALPHHLVTL